MPFVKYPGCQTMPHSACHLPRRCRAASLVVAALSALGCGLPIVSVAAATIPQPAAHPSAAVLSFRIDDGLNTNSFLRQGTVAAHLVLRSGREPRILVAFPAGDSAVGLWFARSSRPVTWTLTSPPRAFTTSDSEGRPLRGIQAQITADAAELTLQRAILSSVRILRDYESLGTVPHGIDVAPSVTGKQLSWARDRLDGAAGYALSLRALGDETVTPDSIRAGRSGRLQLQIRAVTGERPLTPLSAASLLNSSAGTDTRARSVLAFLSYREKFLAGSWRFDTYFGRDTLMTLELLAPALESEAIESALGSVLTRLAPDGEVAHEEEIGEFAVLHNLARARRGAAAAEPTPPGQGAAQGTADSPGPSDRPLYDYSMIDETFLLAPVAAHCLLEPLERKRARTFLQHRDAAGRPNAQSLIRNFAWVIARTADFAAAPTVAHLIGLKPGHNAGEWRDSEHGLGGGRYPYDVNVAFVPAALESIAQFLDSHLLDPYLTSQQRTLLARAASQARVWRTQAPPMFVTSVPGQRARTAVEAYAETVGVDPANALASLPAGAVQFDALALDSAGQPIPVMHSDEGFSLLFGAPAVEDLSRGIAVVGRPFPAGLMTPAGLLVANAAFAAEELQSQFSNTAYHGAVVWSWQQAVLAAGLDRQLGRDSLPPALRSRMRRLRALVWNAIRVTAPVRTSELWSWRFEHGHYAVAPFGQGVSSSDESNAAQLWSTVFLALRPPSAIASVQTYGIGPRLGGRYGTLRLSER